MSPVRQISPFDRILYLKSQREIGQLTNAQITRLAFEAEEAHLDAGRELFGPGGAEPKLYVIISGTVRVDHAGHASTHARAGDAIGFVSMLAGVARARAVAETEVVALSLSLVRILELLEEDFLALQNAVRSLARMHCSLLERVIAGSHREPWTTTIPIPADRDLDLLERLILIRQGDLFAAVGLEAGVMMATSMKQERWSRGEALWKIGDPSGPMWIIVEGQVEATLADSTTFTAGPGYPLGNIESLAQRPRWYQPVARTDLLSFRIDHESFFDVMEDDFSVAESFLSAMAGGIQASMEALLARGEAPQEDDPA